MNAAGTAKAQVARNSTIQVSAWCNSIWKRSWDLFWALALLILFSPLILVLALAVKLSSAGPVFFRQRRPGKGGQEFIILKFRTMVVNGHETGPVLTKKLDPRITWLGRIMRKWKLDELPQLFNVAKGEMSFVGPRPQVTKLWIDPSIQEDASIVLSVKPGITSPATLFFRNEEDLLAPVASHAVEEVYLRTIMPVKLKLEIEYLRKANFARDFATMVRTAGRIFHRNPKNDEFVREQLAAIHGFNVARTEAVWHEPPHGVIVAESDD